jgi:hypothetical protein
MPQIPSRFVEIVEQLRENKQPRRATVRSVLKWFNAARRGANVVAEIEEALKLAGPDTEPPFSQVAIDEQIRFVLRPVGRHASPDQLPAVPQQLPHATSAPQEEGPGVQDNDGAPTRLGFS